MHPLRSLFACALLVAVVLPGAGCLKGAPEKGGAAPPKTFPLDDTLALRDACARIAAFLCPVLGVCDTSSLGRFNRMVDSAALAIRRSAGGKNKGPEALGALLHTVYSSWGIGFDARDTVVETLLPHLVFRNRRGACVGVALVLLMLAEKLDLPVYGVMLPGHFFCRYDDGIRRRNVEPNRKGCEHPDEYYRKRYPLAHRPGYGLGNLDRKAVIGVLCYNAGSLCLRNRRYDAAIACCREAVRRMPLFAEAQGNCAIAYAKKGALDSALALFEQLFAAHPDMENLAVNYGYVATAARHYPLAVSVYQKGLEYFPGDTVLRKRLEKLMSGIKAIKPIQKKE
jgi:regulator of sirC expression with transglutaminase-like and TPR domain